MAESSDEKPGESGFVRDEKGRFCPGTSGGPGRPRGARSRGRGEPSFRDLVELSEPLTGPQAYLMAMQLRDLLAWMEHVKGDFEPAIAKRVQSAVLVADQATLALLRALSEHLRG